MILLIRFTILIKISAKINYLISEKLVITTFNNELSDK